MRRIAFCGAASVPALFGQCSQCFRTAAAQQEAAREALNLGVLVLSIPAFSILAGFAFLTWQRRDP